MSQGRSTLSEAVSKALLVSVPRAVLVVDRAGRIVFVNAQSEELFAYGLDELLFKSIEELLPELSGDERLQQALASPSSPELHPGPVSLELCGISKDGSELLLDISLLPIDTADGPFVCCLIRKNASRQQAEDEQIGRAHV